MSDDVRPMLVFFWSERSGPARRMESLLAHLARKERSGSASARLTWKRARTSASASRSTSCRRSCSSRTKAVGPARRPHERPADRGDVGAAPRGELAAA